METEVTFAPLRPTGFFNFHMAGWAWFSQGGSSIPVPKKFCIVCVQYLVLLCWDTPSWSLHNSLGCFFPDFRTLGDFRAGPQGPSRAQHRGLFIARPPVNEGSTNFVLFRCTEYTESAEMVYIFKRLAFVTICWFKNIFKVCSKGPISFVILCWL